MKPIATTTLNRRHDWPSAPVAWRSCQPASRRVCLPPPNSAAARAGLRFQDECVQHLERYYAGTDWHIVSDLWFEYTIRDTTNIAGPDCLMINIRTGWIIVLEYKLTETDCYKQLFLYMSLLRSLFSLRDWKIAGFVHYKKMAPLPVMYSGPVEHMLTSAIQLEPFAWDGRGLPRVGVFSSSFVPLPTFIGD